MQFDFATTYPVPARALAVAGADPLPRASQTLLIDSGLLLGNRGA